MISRYKSIQQHNKANEHIYTIFSYSLQESDGGQLKASVNNEKSDGYSNEATLDIVRKSPQNSRPFGRNSSINSNLLLWKSLEEKIIVKQPENVRHEAGNSVSNCELKTTPSNIERSEPLSMRDVRVQPTDSNLTAVYAVPARLRRQNSDSELYAKCKKHCDSNGDLTEHMTQISLDKSKTGSNLMLQYRPANHQEFIAELKKVQKELGTDKSPEATPSTKSKNEISNFEFDKTLKKLTTKTIENFLKVKKVTFENNSVKNGWSSMKELYLQSDLKNNGSTATINHDDNSLHREKIHLKKNSVNFASEINNTNTPTKNCVSEINNTNTPTKNCVSKLSGSNLVSSIIEQYTQKCLSNTNLEFKKITSEQSDKNVHNFIVPKVRPREPMVTCTESVSDSILKESKSSIGKHNTLPKANDLFFGIRSAGDGGDSDRTHHVLQYQKGDSEKVDKSKLQSEIQNDIPSLRNRICNVTSSEESDVCDSRCGEQNLPTSLSQNKPNKAMKNIYNQTSLNSQLNIKKMRTYPSVRSNTPIEPGDVPTTALDHRIVVRPQKSVNKKRSTARSTRRQRSISSQRSASVYSSSSEEELEDIHLKIGSMRSLEDLSRFKKLEVHITNMKFEFTS